jgi:hypothetical protein
MLLPVILAVAATVGALLYLARPLFGRAQVPPAPADGLDAGRLELVEERDRAVAALRELEFDHRTGKITDFDYREQVGPLRRRVGDALKALGPGARTEDERKART